jgi:hypothetical protein
MDLISREEVHRDLAFYIYELATDALTVGEFTTKIRECIDGIPSQNKWIPVKERLPEDNGDYLVTGRQGAVNKRRFQDGRWYGNWAVLAWMPLPEVYKESEEE